MLYDFIQCPHRLSLDLFEDPFKRDPINPFIKLLWEKGINYEKEVIQKLNQPFLDLSTYFGSEKLKMTNDAMEKGEDLIYGGRIAADDLIGEPDLLRKDNHGYIAGDIKSGAGLEGENDLTVGKPKKHYAVQLALYTDILERLKKSTGRTPFIWDIHGQEIIYNLDAPQGLRKSATWWEEYENCLATTRELASQKITTRPTLSSTCKLCHWRTLCLKHLKLKKDLSLIPELGRSRRDAMYDHFESVSDLADANLENFIQGSKTIFHRIGVGTLQKFHTRAKLLTQPHYGPYLKENVHFPTIDLELFFDIETDPMRDICYLHGFLERKGKNISTENYVSFFADNPTPEDEKRAFAEALEYIKKCQPCAIYYYSAYEKIQWKKLQEKYPQIATQKDIENIFESFLTIDLYNDIVRDKTEWPTNDYSIKTLASFLGFKWRDPSPSGAESIEWYHRWVDNKSDDIKRRILKYNEDDCIATRVLLEDIQKLPVKRNL
jgi:uncharacterized protein